MSETLIEQARRRWKLCLEDGKQQRERETEALRFRVAKPEYQWDDNSRKLREPSTDGKVGGRPMLCIPKLDQPIQLILNQMRNADLSVEVHPISEDANKETAEMKQGLYRSIERDGAELARFWAYDRAVTAGRGAYRVTTEYDPASDNPTDQKIVIKRIYHQEAVYWDPAAQEPDKSDARYAFVVQFLSQDEFEDQYPEAVKDSGGEFPWSEAIRQAPEWFEAGKDVMVAEYWYKDITEKDIGKHRVPEIKLYMQKIGAGYKLLEDKVEWPEPLIPLIPVIGRELQPFDKETRYVGMVEPAMDGARLYNGSASTMYERMQLEPRAPFVGLAEQFEGYEEFWDNANRLNYSRLPYNLVKDAQGNVIKADPPQRTQIDTTGMSLAIMALQEADSFIQASTAVFDPSLGKMPQKERSGRAIMALQQQADAGTSHFLMNFADISLRYEARVVLGLMPHYYDRAERVVRIVRGEDRKSELVMLNAPFRKDPQTGRPIPVPNGQHGKDGVQHFNLSKGAYDVSIKVGKAMQTRMEEGSTRMWDFLGNVKDPRMALALMPIALRFEDWPGSQEAADIMLKLRNQAMPNLAENQDGQPSIEQLQGQIQQMQQMGQARAQQLQMAMQALQTKQAEQQATIQKAQMEADTKVRIAAADNQTQIIVAELKAGQQQIAEQNKLMLEILRLKHEAQEAATAQEHEARMAAQQQEHERETGAVQMAGRALESDRAAASKAGMEREKMQHQAGQADQQRAHESSEAAAARDAAAQEAEAGRAHETGMAAMTPEPAGGEE